MRRILLPLAINGILVGWIYIGIVSFRELSMAILLCGPGNVVLCVLIWERLNNGRFTVVAAIGVFLIVILTGLVLIARRLGTALAVQQ